MNPSLELTPLGSSLHSTRNKTNLTPGPLLYAASYGLTKTSTPMGLLDMFYAYVGVMVETGACGEVQALYVFSSAGMVYAHCREFIGC